MQSPDTAFFKWFSLLMRKPGMLSDSNQERKLSSPVAAIRNFDIGSSGCGKLYMRNSA